MWVLKLISPSNILIGIWNFYQNGEWIYSRKVNNGQSADILPYTRKFVPQNIGNSTDKEKNGREAREKAQKNWGAVRRGFYERFNFLSEDEKTNI